MLVLYQICFGVIVMKYKSQIDWLSNLKEYDKNKLWDCRKYTKQPLANWKTNRIGGNSGKKKKNKTN
jgi:hypothetical protein